MNGQDPPRCECSGDKAFRRRVIKGGTIVYCDQCLECGRQVRVYSRRNMPTFTTTPWDESIVERWKARWAAWSNEQQEQREREKEEWWERYEAHLQSEKWRAIRHRVLIRCKGMCEGCGQRPAVHVHHLTYAHMGNELLFELVGICEPCHAFIHPDRFAEQWTEDED